MLPQRHGISVHINDLAHHRRRSSMPPETPAYHFKAWKVERDTLAAERKRLNQEYVSLKEEVREVEVIRRNVHEIMRAEARREQPKRTKNVEL